MLKKIRVSNGRIMVVKMRIPMKNKVSQKPKAPRKLELISYSQESLAVNILKANNVILVNVRREESATVPELPAFSRKRQKSPKTPRTKKPKEISTRRKKKKQLSLVQKSRSRIKQNDTQFESLSHSGSWRDTRSLPADHSANKSWRELVSNYPYSILGKFV